MTLDLLFRPYTTLSLPPIPAASQVDVCYQQLCLRGFSNPLCSMLSCLATADSLQADFASQPCAPRVLCLSLKSRS